MLEDRRGDVVGQIPIDADATTGGDSANVGFEDVAGNDGKSGVSLRKVAKSTKKSRVELDGVDRGASSEKMLGHFPVTGAEFNPAMLIVAGQRHGGVRRNADGPRDLFAPVQTFQKMLAEALSCHGCNSVASGRRG